jgi:hypothetical protein
MDLNEIAGRVRAGERVSPQEFAYLISNDIEAFMAFLIANNPGSINSILRYKLGYTFELGFTPNIQKIQRIVQIIIDQKKADELQVIMQNFQLNLDALSPQLFRAIKTQFKTD